MQGLLCHPRKRQCVADLMICRAVLLIYAPMSMQQCHANIYMADSNDVVNLDEMALSEKRRSSKKKQPGPPRNGSATPLPPKP